MKQTAVDWLEDNLIGNPFSNEDFQHNRNVFIKAKEIEKYNILKTWYDCKWSIIIENPIDAEQYYKETYGKDGRHNNV